MNQNLPDANLTRRMALANSAGSDAFRNSLFGFNKESVLFYIDNLCRDAAEQEKRLTSTIDQLTAKNRKLSASLADYEKRLRQTTQDLQRETEFNAGTYQRENTYRQALTALQQQVAQMQGSLQAEQQKSAAIYARYAAAENEIQSMRASVGNAAMLQQQLAMRDNVIRQREGELSMRNNQVLQQQHEISGLRQQLAYTRANQMSAGPYAQQPNAEYINAMRQRDSVIAQKDNQLAQRGYEIYALREQVKTLSERVQYLEGQRMEIANGIHNIRAQAAQQQPPQAGEAQNPIQQQVKYYSQKADQIQTQLDHIGETIGGLYNGRMQTLPDQTPQFWPPPGKDIGGNEANAFGVVK